MAGNAIMKGRLTGIGIGPGDPELITLKGLKRLQGAQVLAYPAPEGGDSLARAIVAPHLAGSQIEVKLEMPIVQAPFPAQQAYDRAVGLLSPHLDAGRDVAVICEGDPFFYGSFIYLFSRMAERVEVEVIPGVSSLTACAAALGAPLAARNDILTVIPAPLPPETIAARLEDCDSAAIIKVGRHFPKVREVIESLGLLQCARFVAHATMPDERLLGLDEVDPEGVPYFSMILVHRRGAAWQ